MKLHTILVFFRLITWLLAENDGNVITAHCDCMAGFSEACSHVGALMYAIETGVRMRDSKNMYGRKEQMVNAIIFKRYTIFTCL